MEATDRWAGDEAWAIIVAAGQGHRYGGLKQFDILEGRPVYEWSVAAARKVVSGVVLVVPGELANVAAVAEAADRVVAGAATRSGSVRAGLAAVPESAGIVLVHDAARPLASESLYASVLAALGGGEEIAGAVPGLPIVDTVKEIENGIVRATLDRTRLVRVQTPQGFRADWLRRAHAPEPEATDDAAVVEAIGGKVVIVPGEADNLKITTADDLAAVEQLCAFRARRRQGVPETEPR